MPEPRVSVVVPVYNGARHLGEALRSVQSQDVATEIVVVDDGSTDESAAVAEAVAGVRVIRQANAGPAAARNTGIAHASAPLLAFIDADDVWPEGRLARLVAALDADDRLGAVMGQLQMVVATDDGFAPVLSPQFGFQFGTAVVRRSTFEAVGEIDTALRNSEDVDWFMRAREAGVPMARLGEVVSLYRQHADSLTAAPEADDFLLTLALKRSLDRRRASGRADLPDLPLVP